MKNFQQNLLVLVAAGLCALCVYQWRAQTRQRNDLGSASQLLYERTTAIQGYTNSIKAMDDQIAQMDAKLAELRTAMKAQDELVSTEKQEARNLRAANDLLTNTVAQYKQVLDKLESKLREAADDIEKQNDAIKEVTAQRDDFVQKLNDSVKERNDIVKKYNALVKSSAK